MGVADHIAIQRAVFDALCAHTPLLGLLADGAGGVGVSVAPESRLPYVVIENIASQPLRTQAEALDDYTVTCAVYDDQPGGTQLRAIAREVALALSAPFAVDGHRVVMQQGGGMQVQMIGDGKVYRAICTLRLIVEQLEG